MTALATHPTPLEELTALAQDYSAHEEAAPVEVRVTEFLTTIIDSVHISGANPAQPFLYIGGPMSGIAHFNYPRFRQVTQRLRDEKLNVVSPVELVDAAMVAEAATSADGGLGSGDVAGVSHADIVSRDFIVCSLPTCAGGVLLEGWEHSKGALAETWILAFRGKPLYEYADTADGFKLHKIQRDERLLELGVESSCVPADLPGVKTAAARAGAGA